MEMWVICTCIYFVVILQSIEVPNYSVGLSSEIGGLFGCNPIMQQLNTVKRGKNISGIQVIKICSSCEPFENILQCFARMASDSCPFNDLSLN